MFKNKAKRLFRAAKLQHQRQQNANGDQAAAGEQHELEEPALVKQEYFDSKQCHRAYSCAHCRAHLADHNQLISKLFQGNHGRAYLFNKVVNIGCKQAVQRELLTGLHAVADIYCDNCETTLGWKYEQAFVPSQKYKEGKYIIEMVHMLKENNWDLTSYNAREIIRDTTEFELERNYQDNNNSSSSTDRYNCSSNNTKFQHQYQYQYYYTSPAAAPAITREHQDNSAQCLAGDGEEPLAVGRTNDATNTIDDRPCSVILANSRHHQTLEVVDGETLLETNNNNNTTTDDPLLVDSSSIDAQTATNPPTAKTTEGSDNEAAGAASDSEKCISISMNDDDDARETESIEVIEKSLAKLMAATAATDQVLISVQSLRNKQDSAAESKAQPPSSALVTLATTTINSDEAANLSPIHRTD